jgi:spermidine synthase
MQYNEFYHKKTGLTVGVEKVLFSKQSDYQKVEILKTDTWGNLMTIDGMVMLSEKDEFVYHELLVHIAMLTHPEPRDVLIIGGGDGGSAREAMKHNSVQQVDMVEIDEVVIESAKLHLPMVGDWDNPKLNLMVRDGITYLNESDKKYDVIIIDGSDPVGPAEGLFEENFIKACYAVLKEDGVLTTQTESPWVESYHTSIRKVFDALDNTFDHSAMYLGFIPLYPAGMWSFGFGSKGVDALDDKVLERAHRFCEQEKGSLKYYNPDIHRAAFALPNFVEQIIR